MTVALLEREYTISCQRFLPSDVKQMWDMLFDILKRSEMYTDEGIVRMLTDCMVPKGLQMWVLKGEKNDGSVFPAGCVITSMPDEPYTGHKWMIILHTNDVAPISIPQWRDVYAVLEAHSKENGCEWIETYTQNPRVIEILADLEFHPAAYRKVV